MFKHFVLCDCSNLPTDFQQPYTYDLFFLDNILVQCVLFLWQQG